MSLPVQRVFGSTLLLNVAPSTLMGLTIPRNFGGSTIILAILSAPTAITSIGRDGIGSAIGRDGLGTVIGRDGIGSAKGL